jgi:hypothetical protein
VTAGVSLYPFGPQTVAKILVVAAGTESLPFAFATPFAFVVTVVMTPKNEQKSPQSSSR